MMAFHLTKHDDKYPDDHINNVTSMADPHRPYVARRMGYKYTDGNLSMWNLNLHDTTYSHGWYDGFRLCADLKMGESNVQTPVEEPVTPEQSEPENTNPVVEENTEQSEP